METPHHYTKEALSKMLAALDDRDTYGFILRAKGVLPVEGGGWMEFDYVPEECELRDRTRPDVTGKIVVIGADLNEAKLEDLFRGR